MPTRTTHPTTPPAGADTLKNWIMVVLTLVFISLYGAALIGWLKPLADEKMVLRLEPILFVIIGYYFGRLPAQQNEKTLKQEISRQTQRGDADRRACSGGDDLRVGCFSAERSFARRKPAASSGRSDTDLEFTRRVVGSENTPNWHLTR